jgi:sigma-B regulation protein RsbU (phosphoserine phosphatase)
VAADRRSLEVLLEAGKVLNSTLEVQTLISLVYDLILASVDCETCSLGRLREKGTEIHVLLAFGKSGEEVSSLMIDRGVGVMGTVVETGKPIILNRTDDIKQYVDRIDKKFDYEKRSCVSVPLLRGGEVIGALEAINKEDGDFTGADVEMLTDLAEQVAIALDNARLYERVRREVREKELLYEVGQRISSSLDLEEVLDLVMDCLGEVVAFAAGGIYVVDPDTQEIASLATMGYERGMEEKVHLKFGTGIVGWVAKNREPAIVEDVSQDSRYINARSETSSEIVVPLFADDKIIGVINLESDEVGAFTPDDLALIKAFGSQVAVSLERAKLHAQILERRKLVDELEVARQIQRSFLPDVIPDIPGYDLSAINIPSEAVGGDYYDIIPISDGQWGITIADVFGKGVPAALVMASYRASLLAEIRNNYMINAILRKVNRLIWESVEPERCVTACYGVLDAESGIFTYSNAGHLHPIIIGKKGIRHLDKGGILLGAIEKTEYREERVYLEPGDVVLFFTDGLTEAEDVYGEPFGEEKLIEEARPLVGRPSSEIVKSLHQAVYKFSAGHLGDDFTLLVLKVKEEENVQ